MFATFLSCHFVYSTDGYLFDKEAILEYYIAKKKEIARQLKEYEKQKKQDENEVKELKAAAHRSQVEKFIGDFLFCYFSKAFHALDLLLSSQLMF